MKTKNAQPQQQQQQQQQIIANVAPAQAVAQPVPRRDVACSCGIIKDKTLKK